MSTETANNDWEGSYYSWELTVMRIVNYVGIQKYKNLFIGKKLMDGISTETKTMKTLASVHCLDIFNMPLELPTKPSNLTTLPSSSVEGILKDAMTATSKES
jgi:hypothetical protein